MEGLARQVKGARHVSVPNAAHIANIQNPEGFNRVLADAADEHSNVRLVDWAALVEGDGTLLASDAVHATPDGYARRANETARVMRDCPGQPA